MYLSISQGFPQYIQYDVLPSPLKNKKQKQSPIIHVSIVVVILNKYMLYFLGLWFIFLSYGVLGYQHMKHLNGGWYNTTLYAMKFIGTNQIRPFFERILQPLRNSQDWPNKMNKHIGSKPWSWTQNELKMWIVSYSEWIRSPKIEHVGIIIIPPKP